MKHDPTKITKQFSLFAAIGLGLLLIYSAINWVLIDVLGGNSAIIAPAGICVFFLLKYKIYVALKVMHAKFATYCMANLGLLIISSIILPVLIEFSPLNAFWSTWITLCGMVVVRFTVFYALKIIR